MQCNISFSFSLTFITINIAGTERTFILNVLIYTSDRCAYGVCNIGVKGFIVIDTRTNRNYEKNGV